MVVAIVPGMGTVLEGADELQLAFEGHTFLPDPTTANSKNDKTGVLAELQAMNALHMGLYKWLESRGVQFTAIAGLSASEPCGLALAGALPLHQLEPVTKVCADLYNRLADQGSMLVVLDVSKQEALQAVEKVGGTTSLGAWFGAAAGAITGNTQDMDKVRRWAETKGWKHLTPKVGYGDRIPFHCPSLFAPFQSPTLFEGVEFTKPKLPYFSSYTGGEVAEMETLSFRDFMCSSLAGTAHSCDAIRACVRAGHRKFVELNLKPLYVRTVEEAFVAEGINTDEAEVYCCAPSKAEMEALAMKLAKHSADSSP